MARDATCSTNFEPDSAVDVSGLLTPLTINSVQLRNRFALAPMTRYATPDGIPTGAYVDYFRRRAAGGMGLLITESILIPAPSTALDLDMVSFFRSEAVTAWKKVVDAVHEEGAVIFAQLLHAGVYRGPTPASFPDVPTASPSGIDFYGDKVGQALNLRDIDHIVESYAVAGREARRAGFDGIEIHGAHGYLPDLFLWGSTNQRTDFYGGTLTDRTRFAGDVIRALRDEVGSHTAISFRFSQWKADLYDARLADTPHQLEALLEPLMTAGVDVFHPSTRRHDDVAFPELTGNDSSLSLAGWTKKITRHPTITVGSIGLSKTIEGQGDTADGRADIVSLQTLVDQYHRGEFDIAAIGRAALANPDFVDKIRAGRHDTLTPYDQHQHKLTLQ